jgi:hypothetical protein
MTKLARSFNGPPVPQFSANHFRSSLKSSTLPAIVLTRVIFFRINLFDLVKNVLKNCKKNTKYNVVSFSCIFIQSCPLGNSMHMGLW